MRILVVGAGAMGRWFARSVEAEIAFTDVDTDTAREAASAIDAAVVDPETEAQFDAVCFAVPISSVTAAIEQYANRADRALLDVSGVMSGPITTMRDWAPDRERVSLHPLFAPENAPGNVAVVADRRGPVVESVLSDLRTRGNELFETTAEEHDEAMETVQASAHAAVLAFAMAADDVPDRFQTPISAGLFDLVEQVTGGDPRVYADIQDAFDGADAVADAARQIADADSDTFERLYEQLS
jgi:prephenate dehydrogenase